MGCCDNSISVSEGNNNNNNIGNIHDNDNDNDNVNNYMKAYEIIKSNIKLIQKKDTTISKGILINTSSIKNFIQIIKKSKVFEYLNEDNELENKEKDLKNSLRDYKLEKNIDIISNYKKCKTMISSNKKENNEFIIVDKEFIKIMNVSNTVDKDMQVEIDKKKMQIIFPTTEIIDFKTKKKGFYNFVGNNTENNNIDISYFNDNDITGNIQNKKAENNIFIHRDRNNILSEKSNNYEGNALQKKKDNNSKNINNDEKNFLINPSLINIKKNTNNSEGAFIEESKVNKKLNIESNKSMNNLKVNNQKEIINNIINNLNIINNENNNNDNVLINENIDEFSFNIALINCFFNIKCLIQHFQLNKIKYSTIPENNEQKKLLREFSYNLYNLHDEYNKENKALNFDCFKNILNEKTIFIDSSKNNIKSLFLLKEIHNELNEVDIINTIETFDSDQTVPEIELYKCITDFECHNKSIIAQNFYFSQANITKCNKCGISIYKYIMQNILIFDLDKIKLYKGSQNNEPFNNLNLYDCFEYYTTEEKNKGENKNVCKKCNEEYKILNKICSFSLPEIFMIYFEGKKNMDFKYKINNNFELLDKYIFKLNNITQHKMPKYELIGIVAKNEEENNHFINYSKYSEKWYLYKSKIEKISEPIENIKDIPYLLIYQKIKE